MLPYFAQPVLHLWPLSRHAFGLLAGHVLDSILSYPAETLANPLRHLHLGDGLSSFGGFVAGAALAAVGAVLLYTRRRGET